MPRPGPGSGGLGTAGSGALWPRETGEPYGHGWERSPLGTGGSRALWVREAEEPTGHGWERSFLDSGGRGTLWTPLEPGAPAPAESRPTPRPRRFRGAAPAARSRCCARPAAAAGRAGGSGPRGSPRRAFSAIHNPAGLFAHASQIRQRRESSRIFPIVKSLRQRVSLNHESGRLKREN